MSNSRGGSDRLGFGGLKIPESVKRTIQDIREITGKQHSDEDIYFVLRECFMDPNETAQKLLYLDTFHEVKRKSERRKVASSPQGRGLRGNRGYHSGNGTVQSRENGVNHTKERGHVASFRAGQRKNNGVLSATNLLNGTSSRGSDLSTGGGVDAAGENLDSRIVGDATSSVASDFAVNWIHDQGKSSKSDNLLPTLASDTVMTSSIAWHSGLAGSLKCEVERKSAEQNHGDMHSNGNLESGLSRNEQILTTVVNSVSKEDPGSVASMQNHLSDSLEATSLSAGVESLDISSAEEMVASPRDISLEDAKSESSAQLVPQSTVTNGLVTFPDHLKVPEALKSGFIFGSFNGNGSDTATAVTEENRTAMDPLSSEQNAQVDNSDQSESPRQLSENLPESGTNVFSDTEMNQLNQEITLPPDGQVNCTVPIAPNYGFEIKPAAERGQLVQLEGQETKAHTASHLSSFVGDSFTTPPQTTPVQNPVAVAPQPLHFRPPYHPNFLPYGHYYNPYFLPPFHQFLSPNGLPQQPSTGNNAYLTPATTASGVKFPIPLFKPGTNGVNSSLYGSYGFSPASFNPGPTMNLGGTANNEDVSSSQLKGSQVYTTSSMSKTSAWIPPGHEMSSLPLNSFYHLPPHGQHLGFPPAQTGHTPFPGIYPSVQTATAPPTSNQILQHSQPMSVSAETVGPPPSAAFQQPQLAQMSWNSSY